MAQPDLLARGLTVDHSISCADQVPNSDPAHDRTCRQGKGWRLLPGKSKLVTCRLVPNEAVTQHLRSQTQIHNSYRLDQQFHGDQEAANGFPDDVR